MSDKLETAGEQNKQNEKKWSKKLIDAGWTVLPSVILDRQQALGLDAVDINILMHLAKYWWYSDTPPRPSKNAIAECMGIDKSTVRRRIAQMEKDGLISRKPRFDSKYGQQTNTYNFDGLIEAATPYAEEVIAAKNSQKQEAAKRRTRKRPTNTNDQEK